MSDRAAYNARKMRDYYASVLANEQGNIEPEYAIVHRILQKNGGIMKREEIVEAMLLENPYLAKNERDLASELVTEALKKLEKTGNVSRSSHGMWQASEESAS